MEESLGDAARRLGISRRYANDLARSGALAGRQLADGTWLINSDTVHALELRRKGPGRSLRTETAWAVLFELSGVRARWLPSRTVSRVRERLSTATPNDLAVAVAHRSRMHRFYADRARVQAALIPTGGAATHLVNTNLVGAASTIDGYLHPGVSFDVISAQYLLFEDPTGPDVIREAFEHYASPMPAVIAADLATSLAPREREAGLQLLASLLESWLLAH